MWSRRLEISSRNSPANIEIFTLRFHVLEKLLTRISSPIMFVLAMRVCLTRRSTVQFWTRWLSNTFCGRATRILRKSWFKRQSWISTQKTRFPTSRWTKFSVSSFPFFQIANSFWISDALKNHNLEPALEWAQANREQLNKNNSNFEFKLHRLQFIELLRGGLANQMALIEYSRINFRPFADRFSTEIQVLMGSLMYLKSGIEHSPYKYLLEPSNWIEICHMFTKEACSLLEVSVDSPLSVTFNAGCVALPALINIKQAIQQRHVTGVWTSLDELPIEIDVTRKCHYHSIFACPILRQQSCDTNPPMRLTCGHVISRDALHKLTNGSKLKCPYCPVEQNPADARLISF